MKTWQKSKVFLSLYLSSSLAVMTNCCGSRKTRDKGVERRSASLSLIYRRQMIQKSHQITPNKQKKHSNKKKPKSNKNPTTNKKTSQIKTQKNQPHQTSVPCHSAVIQVGGEEAIKFYFSHFWWLLQGRSFSFHKFRSFVKYKAVFQLQFLHQYFKEHTLLPSKALNTEVHKYIVFYSHAVTWLNDVWSAIKWPHMHLNVHFQIQGVEVLRLCLSIR